MKEAGEAFCLALARLERKQLVGLGRAVFWALSGSDPLRGLDSTQRLREQYSREKEQLHAGRAWDYLQLWSRLPARDRLAVFSEGGLPIDEMDPRFRPVYLQTAVRHHGYDAILKNPQLILRIHSEVLDPLKMPIGERGLMVQFTSLPRILPGYLMLRCRPLS